MVLKKARIAPITLGLAVAFTSVPAYSEYTADRSMVNNQTMNAPYRFDYQLTGDDRARPLQVFTDGKQTFVQFPGDVKPSHAMVNGQKVPFHETAAYFVMYGAPTKFSINTNRGSVNVELRNNDTIAKSVLPPEPKQPVTENELRDKIDRQIEEKKIAQAEQAIEDRRKRAADIKAKAEKLKEKLQEEEKRRAENQAKLREKAEAQERAATTLEEGKELSKELREYVQYMGWTDLKWKLDYDYRIDAPIQMKGDMFTAITELVKTYQAQGGMEGVTPRFAAGNRIVVIENMDLAAPMGESN